MLAVTSVHTDSHRAARGEGDLLLRELRGLAPDDELVVTGGQRQLARFSRLADRLIARHPIADVHSGGECLDEKRCASGTRRTLGRHRHALGIRRMKPSPTLGVAARSGPCWWHVKRNSVEKREAS